MQKILQKIPVKLPFILLIVILILLILFIFRSKKPSSGNYSELKEINGKGWDFARIKEYFKKLADAKGAPYSYEVLKLAELPPDTDLHLLGHAVGDVLYEQKGIDGIQFCTEDFRNACSHSIVVGLFQDKGEKALKPIADICRKAPGGKGAYTMCFHGLGHGILAATGFELEQAVDICNKSKSDSTGQNENIHCISGTVMEIVGGGDHDKKTWKEQKDKYLTSSEPLSLCFQKFIPVEARGLCIDYLTPYLFEAAGADLGRPTEEDFKKSFLFCGALPKDDFASRDACFRGFGKEFVGLARSRDIRKIDQMTDEQFKKVYNWCLLADNKDGTAGCIVHAMNSIYWGGENDRSAAIRFCRIAEDDYNRGSCFYNLIDNVSSYIDDAAYKKSFCSEIPREYQSRCADRLL